MKPKQKLLIILFLLVFFRTDVFAAFCTTKVGAKGYRYQYLKEHPDKKRTYQLRNAIENERLLLKQIREQPIFAGGGEGSLVELRYKDNSYAVKMIRKGVRAKPKASISESERKAAARSLSEDMEPSWDSRSADWGGFEFEEPLPPLPMSPSPEKAREDALKILQASKETKGLVRPSPIQTDLGGAGPKEPSSPEEKELCDYESIQNMEAYFHFMMTYRSPKIVPTLYLSVYDPSENIIYLFMEKLDGHLSSKFLMKHEISWYAISQSILKRIKELEENKIIHHDIKPDNMLINKKDLSIYLADFGFATTCGRVSLNTTSTLFGGTPTFSAPASISTPRGLCFSLKKDLIGAGYTLLRLFYNSQEIIKTGDLDAFITGTEWNQIRKRLESYQLQDVTEDETIDLRKILLSHYCKDKTLVNNPMLIFFYKLTMGHFSSAEEALCYLNDPVPVGRASLLEGVLKLEELSVAQSFFLMGI